MVSKSSLIGFGIGSALAGGITYFTLTRDTAPVTQHSPVVESTSTLVEPAAAPEHDTATAPHSKSTPVRPVRAKTPARVVVQEPVARTVEPLAQPPAPAAPRIEPAAAPTPAVTAEAPAPKKNAAPPPPPPPLNKVTIPAGMLVSVRLVDGLASDRAQPGEKFQATLDQPLVVDDFVIAERGARVEGRVVSTEEAGRVRGLASLVLELTNLKTSDGQTIAIATAEFEKKGEKETRSDATKVAVGAGVGAAVGAIFGGGKGAAIGSAAGAGAGAGTVLASRGKPVVLPAETRLSFSIKAPITVTEKR